jgi:hypothetical protein
MWKLHAGGSGGKGGYKMSVTDMLRSVKKKQDEWKTPVYAVEPLLPLLRPQSTILCPFDKADSNFVKTLRKAGHTITYSHISKGKDFFSYGRKYAAVFDYIISNPPYSLKDEVYEHLIYLDRPFAMLMGATAGLFEGKRFEMFADIEPEIMWLKPRVAFIDHNGVAMKSPPFQSCYVCHNVLPAKNMFVRIRREK